MRTVAGALLFTVALAACHAQEQPKPTDKQVTNSTAAAVQVAPPAAASVNVTKGSNVPAAEKQQPTNAVDPKSPQAAVAVVRTFAQAIEGHRLNDAFAMLSGNQDKAGFVNRFADLKTINATVGSAQDTEGAAGSIYTTVPLTLTGKKNSGEAYSMGGDAVLRRVNDVPGSTEAQRRWHIERLEWTTGA